MKHFDVRVSVVFLLMGFVALAITAFATGDVDYAHVAFALLIVAGALAIGCV